MAISTIPNESKTKQAAQKNQAMFSELDKKKHWSFWKIFGWLFLFGILFIVGGVTTLVAATGAVQVPGISNLVYATAPAPARIVSPAVFNLDEALKSVAATKDGSVNLVLNEQQLTSLVSAAHISAFRQAQITIDSTGISFFGYVITIPFSNPVAAQASLAPTVTGENAVACNITKLSLGNVEVPRQFVAPLGTFACNQLSSSLQQSDMTLTGLVLSNQSLTLTYKPAATATPAIPGISLPQAR